MLSILSAERSLGTKMHFFEKYPGGTSLWQSIKNSPDSTIICQLSGPVMQSLLR